jgi:hypothetical protein
LHRPSELDLDATAPEIFNEESSQAVGGKGESVVGELGGEAELNDPGAGDALRNRGPGFGAADIQRLRRGRQAESHDETNRGKNGLFFHGLLNKRRLITIPRRGH